MKRVRFGMGGWTSTPRGWTGAARLACVTVLAAFAASATADAVREGVRESVGSGGTGAVLSGPISGFGSVIVCGARIDDSDARITLDDSDAGASRHDLKLGMTIHVETERHPVDGKGKAATISGRSFVMGPVSDLDIERGRLTVLGVHVTVVPNTVFDGAAGLGALRVGGIVEIHGLPDAEGKLRATRIEARRGTGEIRLTGPVANLSDSVFTVNGIPVHFVPADLFDIPGGLANGMMVRIKGTRSDLVRIVASQVRRASLAPLFRDGHRVLIEGIVTRFASPADFDVAGTRVRAAGVVPRGELALGAVVEVAGAMAGNVLIATSVNNDEEDTSHGTELHARIHSVDARTRTFTMRNGDITIRWDADTAFGTAAQPMRGQDLTPGLEVSVVGSVHGDKLLAASIRAGE